MPKDFAKKDMHLSESDTLGAGDFQLQISAVSEAVEVAAQGAVVQTESGDRIQVIDSSEVQDRLARGRDAMAMLQILPGVLNDDTGSDVVCQIRHSQERHFLPGE